MPTPPAANGLQCVLMRTTPPVIATFIWASVAHSSAMLIALVTTVSCARRHGGAVRPATRGDGLRRIAGPPRRQRRLSRRIRRLAGRNRRRSQIGVGRPPVEYWHNPSDAPILFW